MRTLCKLSLMVAMCWMVLSLVDGETAQARHGYHAARHAYRHAYRPVHVHAVHRHAYYGGVSVVTPRVRVHVGPTVGVYGYPAAPVYAAPVYAAPVYAAPVYAAPVYGGYYHGW